MREVQARRNGVDSWCRSVSLSALLLIGLATLASAADPAPQAEEKKPAAGNPKIQVTLTDDAGQPIGDAELHFNGQIYGIKFNQRFHTDENGKLTLPISPNAKVQHLWMTCTRQGFAPIHYHWRSDTSPVKMPSELNLKMSPGAPLVGLVQDEAGAPIAGAKIEIHMPITSPKTSNWVFDAFNGQTDATGHWVWDSAPDDLSQLGIAVTHADFLRASSSGSNAAKRESLAVMKRGITVGGRVTDAAGKPIRAAVASLGYDRFGTDEPTAAVDAEGRFLLKNCKPGKTLITVQVEGFAPQLREVTIGAKNDDVDFKLEPGHTVRFRVVDSAGKPIKATFAADTWRNYRSLELRLSTDAEGRAVWNSAPDDAVLYDFFQTGYMSVRNVSLAAGEKEHTITMPGELIISGQVTDAETGQPIPQFEVRRGYQFQGQERIYWPNDEGPKFKNGAYTFKHDEPSAGHYLQFIADDYKSAISRAFKSDEGKQTYDIKLEKAVWLAGTVVQPDGTPASGAELAILTKDNPGYVRNGKHSRNGAAELITADAQGRFKLKPQGPLGFRLLVVHHAGIADIGGQQLKPDVPIQLAAWGTIEGRVIEGTHPAGNELVNYSPKLELGDTFRAHYDYSTKTDAQGNFRIDHVPPGSGFVSRVVVTEFIRSQQHAPCWQVPIDVQPGANVAVIIGGTGRPVSGRIELDRQPDVTVDWGRNEPITVNRQEPKETPAESRRYFRCAAAVDSSGRFRIPDVPAGDYELTLPVNNPPTPNACGAGDAIGRANFKFTVPVMTDNRSDEVLDLGSITAKMFDTLDVGEEAPSFELEKLDANEKVKLTDYKGRLVLLDFWATWCGPCLAEMPAIQELYEKHRENPRFALIGLSCDNELNAPSKYAREQKFPWTQAFLGPTYSQWAQRFAIRSLPMTYLIAPDGRVLAKNLRGKALEEAIAKALADEKLFAK